jgi:tRNA-specific 2-thiouridylase
LWNWKRDVISSATHQGISGSIQLVSAKDLGLSGGPWFVIKKDINRNIIYVSRGYDVETQYGNEFYMRDFHFITENPWDDDKEVNITFKIRHTPTFMAGTLRKEKDVYHLVSDSKLQGIAPGQFGVIYDEHSKLCIGSGEIALRTSK